MNAQQEAVALFLHLESRGFRPSVRAIGRFLRELGVSFDDKALRVWLKPFTAVPPQPTAEHRSAPQESSTITAAHPSPPQDTAPAPRLRAHDKVSLFSNLASGTSSPQRGAVQPRLKLTDPIEERARLLLDTLWPVVEPVVATSMTRKEWRQQNKRTALDLVRAGRSVEAVVAAHAELSRRKGEPIWSLPRVQKALIDSSTPPAQPAGNRPQPEYLRRAFERGAAAQGGKAA